MKRVVALIDGEHYPPVVRFALERLGECYEVVGAVFLGGTEKVDLERGLDTYGVDVEIDASGVEGMRVAVARWRPEAFVDLSDEPVVSASDRMKLASVALAAGADYIGADFEFRAPRRRYAPKTPTLSIVGTGKRVGKTAVSAYAARVLKGSGHDIVVLAMGRGGPGEPELIRGDQVELTTPELLALARRGVHASSDNYEDAVMSRVTTVGCRRCGGGLAGETFFDNVIEGAQLADSLGKELLVAEGSGAAIPPVRSDATIVVVSASRGSGYVTDFFGPYRFADADLVVVTGAEPPLATPESIAEIVAALGRVAPDVPVVLTGFRPKPLVSVAGQRVLFATTAPAQVAPMLARHLEQECGARSVEVVTALSNRSVLRAELAAREGSYDVLLTELKAAAIDVVAAHGEAGGVPTVLCDNDLVGVDGSDPMSELARAAALAIARGIARGE
jgi:cyclic 2,3-diphosphoglycerate synthetase